MDTPLHVLADAPALKPGAPTTSRMVVAKTGKFRDRRYGSFEITRKDFDEWRASLSLHPDGQVMVDLDHASEKGKSTEAAGWITGLDTLGADGKTATPAQLWATVEWTSLGVEAIRDRRYRFVSPSYGPYEDERGTKHSNVLTSVALTNRPFLREGMPAVTLSQNFDPGTLTSVAASRRRDTAMTDTARMTLEITGRSDGRICGLRGDETAVELAAEFDTAFDRMLLDGRVEASDRNRALEHWLNNRCLARSTHGGTEEMIATGALLGRLLSDDPHRSPHRMLAAVRPSTHERETTRRETAKPIEPPSDLSTAAKALWRKAAERSRRKSIPFLVALSEITGYPPKGDVPPPGMEAMVAADKPLPGVDMWRVEQHRVAVRLMLELEVGYVEAHGIAEIDAELAQAEADDGSNDVPWLDTSRDERPIPWSTADWERDQRRGKTIGLFLNREEWNANAETGVDIVFVEAEKQRKERRANLRAMRSQKIDSARAAERGNRRIIIEDNLARMSAGHAIDAVMLR